MVLIDGTKQESDYKNIFYEDFKTLLLDHYF